MAGRATTMATVPRHTYLLLAALALSWGIILMMIVSTDKHTKLETHVISSSSSSSSSQPSLYLHLPHRRVEADKEEKHIEIFTASVHQMRGEERVIVRAEDRPETIMINNRPLLIPPKTTAPHMQQPKTQYELRRKLKKESEKDIEFYKDLSGTAAVDTVRVGNDGYNENTESFSPAGATGSGVVEVVSSSLIGGDDDVTTTDSHFSTNCPFPLGIAFIDQEKKSAWLSNTLFNTTPPRVVRNHRHIMSAKNSKRRKNKSNNNKRRRKKEKEKEEIIPPSFLITAEEYPLVIKRARRVHKNWFGRRRLRCGVQQNIFPSISAIRSSSPSPSPSYSSVSAADSAAEYENKDSDYCPATLPPVFVSTSSSSAASSASSSSGRDSPRARMRSRKSYYPVRAPNFLWMDDVWVKDFYFHFHHDDESKNSTARTPDENKDRRHPKTNNHHHPNVRATTDDDRLDHNRDQEEGQGQDHNRLIRLWNPNVAKRLAHAHGYNMSNNGFYDLKREQHQPPSPTPLVPSLSDFPYWNSYYYHGRIGNSMKFFSIDDDDNDNANNDDENGTRKSDGDNSATAPAANADAHTDSAPFDDPEKNSADDDKSDNTFLHGAMPCTEYVQHRLYRYQFGPAADAYRLGLRRHVDYLSQSSTRRKIVEWCSKQKFLLSPQYHNRGVGSAVSILVYEFLHAIMWGRRFQLTGDWGWASKACARQDWTCYFTAVDICSTLGRSRNNDGDNSNSNNKSDADASSNESRTSPSSSSQQERTRSGSPFSSSSSPDDADQPWYNITELDNYRRQAASNYSSHSHDSSDHQKEKEEKEYDDGVYYYDHPHISPPGENGANGNGNGTQNVVKKFKSYADPLSPEYRDERVLQKTIWWIEIEGRDFDKGVPLPTLEQFLGIHDAYNQSTAASTPAWERRRQETCLTEIRAWYVLPSSHRMTYFWKLAADPEYIYMVTQVSRFMMRSAQPWLTSLLNEHAKGILPASHLPVPVPPAPVPPPFGSQGERSVAVAAAVPASMSATSIASSTTTSAAAPLSSAAVSEVINDGGEAAVSKISHHDTDMSNRLLIYVHDRNEIRKYVEFYSTFGCHRFDFVEGTPTVVGAMRRGYLQRHSADGRDIALYVSGNAFHEVYEELKVKMGRVCEKHNISIPLMSIWDSSLLSGRVDRKKYGATHPAASWLDLWIGGGGATGGWMCATQSNWCRVIDSLRLTLPRRGNLDCPFVDLGVLLLGDPGARHKYCNISMNVENYEHKKGLLLKE